MTAGLFYGAAESTSVTTRDPEAEQAGLRGVYECDVCQMQQVTSNTVFADVHADRLCY